jgi:hypothetical protein
MAKGAITFNVIAFSFFRFVILLLVALTFVMLTNTAFKSELDTGNVELDILAQGIMRSPNSISYVEGQRTYTGVIDIDRYSKVSLDETFHNDKNSFIAAKVELLTSAGQAYKGLAPRYLNKEKYELWYPLAKTGWIGRGSAQQKEKIFPVTIIENGVRSTGAIRITLVAPNS